MVVYFVTKKNALVTVLVTAVLYLAFYPLCSCVYFVTKNSYSILGKRFFANTLVTRCSLTCILCN